MIREVAMGEVEPCDVEARADEAFQHVRCFGGWSDRGHDFGLVVGEWHHSSTMPSRSLRACYFRFAQSISYRSHLLSYCRAPLWPNNLGECRRSVVSVTTPLFEAPTS